jgi:hypothetical protein
MISIKEQIENYLSTNFDSIESSRTTDKDFRWSTIANQLYKQTKITSDSESLRRKFLQLRQKQSSPIKVLNSTDKYPFLNSKEDKNQGTKEFSFTADNIPSEEEIISHFNIDITKWTISQIYHKTSFGGKYAITVNQRAKVGNQTINLDEAFIEAINQIKPLPLLPKTIVNNKEKACLLIPKQDVHWDKRDVDGNNDMEKRFETFTKSLLSQLEKVQLTNSLEKIIYIVGSDEFNSEWTGATTKGTIQSNIVSYQEGFKRISNYTIELIKLLRFYTPKVEVVLLNGNHDHNVSWHLAHLLEQVFFKNDSITIDSDLKNTKILEYSTNLILMNHGDEMKPKDLATKFPIIAKDKWSSFDNYFVITGDRHHEQAYDYNGVRTYQVPQLSTAKSSWDDKKGHLCSKAELVTFLFEQDGLSNILRKVIK